MLRINGAEVVAENLPGVVVSSFQIRKDKAIIEIIQDESGVDIEGIYAYVAIGGSDDLAMVPAVQTEGTVILDVESLRFATALYLISKIDGQFFNLERKATGMDMARLLPTTLDDILSAIRWDGRISDYETRRFVALNSFHAVRSNFRLAVYCLLAIGYTAIERHDESTFAVVENLGLEIVPDEPLATDIAPYTSLLTMLWHISVVTGQRDSFVNYMDALRMSVPSLKAEPTASYNVALSLLAGGEYYLHRGENDRALTMLQAVDEVFKIAAFGYPRHPKAFLEIIDIHKFNYFSLICEILARGEEIPDVVEFPGHESILLDANRIRGLEEKKFFLQKFELMTSLSAV